MLRSATLFRALAAPSRQILQQSAPAPVFASRRWLATTPSETPSTPTPASNTPPTSQTTPVTPSTPTTPKPKKNRTPAPSPPPYHVTRTPSNNFAVYHLAKRGGNKKLTSIKKVDGDRLVFRSALAQHLKMDERDIKINSLTKHVEVPVRLHFFWKNRTERKRRKGFC